jgi:1,2-diacylglycerol 3-alpha-glucosyltransferase
MTFVEAAACGLPLFAREDPALKDVVIENETGFYFKNSNELAEKLEYYGNMSENEKSEMLKMSYKKSREYDLDHFYSSIIDVYQMAK